MRAKRASPPQELEFTGPEGPKILASDIVIPVFILYHLDDIIMAVDILSYLILLSLLY